MPTSSVGRTGSTRRGVTLLEMIVVVAIVGLIVGISFPAITAGIDAVRMVSATDSVAAFLNAAVNRAQRRQEAVEVIIDPKENQITAYSNDPTFTRELKLPDGIAFESEQPELRRVILLPGASVPGISIHLMNRRGGRRIVRLDPMTGYPRVEAVAVK
jgi:prepilin-type N-terminal cleavage/methylation domain-containing protein